MGVWCHSFWPYHHSQNGAFTTVNHKTFYNSADTCILVNAILLTALTYFIIRRTYFCTFCTNGWEYSIWKISVPYYYFFLKHDPIVLLSNNYGMIRKGIALNVTSFDDFVCFLVLNESWKSLDQFTKGRHWQPWEG